MSDELRNEHAEAMVGGGMSVLQDWVMRLPLREQGTLLTGIRGCDLAPKNPLTIVEKTGCSTGEDTVERSLVAFFRFCVMNPADTREIDIPGAFFQSAPPEAWKPSQFGHYPEHWYSHLMHGFEVVGYRRPHTVDCMGPGVEQADGICPTCDAYGIYVRLVRNLHLNPETRDQMIERLAEDRIAAGDVVS